MTITETVTILSNNSLNNNMTDQELNTNSNNTNGTVAKLQSKTLNHLLNQIQSTEY